ncbi:hypothetical protein CKO11_13920 [Rhodobacter sp. TJ_12]|uniref:HlyD family type I secretion periplasmic adaptor subunit n=1 Tax=Rhodobacter sp. TJ_12 TaxID=2029399 RepID=UPI001CBE8C34|nr:HlyD family type I secretion periplasmic adaptor subunit [Rhodobacter sp. TJ_12]MBZ4023555.1 hypothetical protein [Rhodobacter sp. TJ_12]
MTMDWSPRRFLLWGFVTLFLGLGGFVAWAVATEITGAVVASGRVEVAARRQVLQHPDGGIVAAIEIRDGDSVIAGEPLIRLDGTELEAQKSLLQRQLYEALAQMDRLQAEVLDHEHLTYRPELTQIAAARPEIARLLQDERSLFESRRDTIRQTLAQFDERKVQTEALIHGYTRQIAAQQRQLDLIEQEIRDQDSLFERGLTQFARVSTLRRAGAELEGEIARLEASIAEARSAIAGYEIQRLRTIATRREEAQDALRELQPQEIRLRENLRVVDTRLGRLVLRAPMSGRVLALQIHTIGGVVNPGSDIVSIVPRDTPLIFTVRIDPRQIDRVRPGLPASIRFPNFNSRITPSFSGYVSTVSADTVSDPQTGAAYYTAELELSDASLAGFDLQPGMPLEAFIETGARSPASFLVKPFTDYLSYALRED